MAAKALYNLLGLKNDFEPVGNLGLKPWMGKDFGWELPQSLKLELTRAIPPYDKQIEEAQRQLGATFLRQRMRNASGASRINPDTQVAELHGFP